MAIAASSAEPTGASKPAATLTTLIDPAPAGSPRHVATTTPSHRHTHEGTSHAFDHRCRRPRHTRPRRLRQRRLGEHLQHDLQYLRQPDLLQPQLLLKTTLWGSSGPPHARART